MAKIRAREVSESLSGIDGPADPVQRSTSSTGESSDWEGRVKPKGKTGPSPRRMLRRLSASEEIKRAADHSSGDDSPKASLRPIPATTSGAPLPPIRHEVDADNLARFVSATTIATSTTISTSFVKHAGPRAASRDRMRMIRPDEVDGLVPEKVGKMRYDKEGMRWVRDGLDKVDEAGESRVGGSEESEDVFAGMESWREEKAPQVVEDSSTSQGQDAGPSRLEGLHNEIEPPPQRPVPVHACSAPAILTPAPAGSGSLRPIRSALRNANSATPAGALKKRAGWHESVTPAGGSESKRSVSFSDGKKNGKMGDLFEGGGGGGERSWMPSARTKRIEGMLDDLEDLSGSTSFAHVAWPIISGLDDGTPSKPPRSFEPPNFSASQDVDQSYNPPVRASRKRSAADATFLTECSFGVTHDRLVQLITDVYGSEPWWDHLRSLNLRGKGADSVARLKEFLPELDEVVLFVLPPSE